jgi:hypothetical protein
MKDKVFGKLGGLNLPVLIGGVVTLAVVVLLAALIINALTKTGTSQDETVEGPIPSVSMSPVQPTVTPVPVKSVQGVNTQTTNTQNKPATAQPQPTTTTVRTVTTEDVIVKLNPRCTKMRARWNPEDPYQVSFTTEGQADGASVVNYQWDFDGNGSWDSEEGRVENSIGYRYSEKKSYTVKSRVRDSLGRWSETCEIGIDLNSN